MTQQIEHSDATVRRPWWRRAVAFVLLWLYRLVGSTIILSALLVLFAQTDMFRRWAKDVILDVANDALLGKVVVEDVRLDIFHGISLIHPQVYASDSTLVLDAKEISISYDLAPLLNNIAAINEIRLIEPKINIQRKAGDSSWNIDKIVKPSTDTTSSDPLDWHFVLRSLRIDKARLYVNDLNTPWGDGKHFDSQHMSLRDIDLRLTGRLSPKRKDYAVVLNHLKFVDNTGILKVNHLSFVARVAPGIVEIPTLRGRLQNTDIALRAQIDGVDLMEDFSVDSLRAHPARVRLECDRVAASDIRYFVPGIDIEEWFAVKGDVVFNGRDIVMKDADIRADKTELKGTIAVNYIDGSKPLELDVLLKNSYARYTDVKRRIKFIDLPDLPFLAGTKMEKVHMRGIPSDTLWFDVKVSDKPGDMEGQLSLDLRGKEMKYKTNMLVRNGKVQAFMDDTSGFTTSFNGRIVASGTGFDTRTMVANAKIDIERSVIGGRTIRNGAVIVRADGSGIIYADTVRLNVTPMQKDSNDPMAEGIAREMLSLNGQLDMRNTRAPAYKAHIVAEALDLARLAESPNLPARFTAELDVDMVGFELDSIIGSIKGKVQELSLLDRTILPFDLNATSARLADGTRDISLEMNAAKVHMHGNFLPSTVGNVFAAAGSSFTSVIQDRIRHIVKQDVVVQPIAEPLPIVDIQLDVDVSDAGLVNMFTEPQATISGELKLTSHLTTQPDALSLDIDTLTITDISIIQDSMTIVSNTVNMSIKAKLNQLMSAPRIDSLVMSASVDSTLHINDMRIFRPTLALDMGYDSGKFEVAAGVDKMYVAMKGDLEFSPGYAAIRFDSTRFDMDTARGLTWRIMEPSRVEIRDGDYTFTKFRIQRLQSEFIELNGQASLESFKNLTVHVERFNFTDVGRFMPLDEESPLTLLDGVLNSADILINGSWKEPVIDVKMNASNLAYNYEPIGSMVLQLKYANRNAVGNAVISNPRLKSDTNTLRLDIGALPIDLAFASVEERLVNGKPVDISLKATNLALAAAEPFLPAVSRVRGLVNASINVGGTMDDIELTGSASYKNVLMTVTSTNVQYTSDASLRLEKSKLIIDTLVLKNLPGDYAGGIAYVNGEVAFNGLDVATVDFNVRAPRLEVMNLGSQATSSSVYGTLRITTGTARPLRFHGTLGSPTLEGDIRVLYADLIMPQERGTAKKRISNMVTISNNDDSRKQYSDVFAYINKHRDSVRTAPPVVQKKPDTLRSITITRDQLDSMHKLGQAIQDSTEQAEKHKSDSLKVLKELEPSRGSMVDNMEFKLNVYFDGRTMVEMALGSTEVLKADVGLPAFNKPLYFSGKFIDNSTNLAGKLVVKEGSTYDFFRKFNASGEIDFDIGGLSNPSINLTAVYRSTRIKPGTTDKREAFKVQIDIRGTKDKPSLFFRIFFDDVEQTGDQSKAKGDAIALILFGRTNDENLIPSGQGGGGVAEQLNDLIAMQASAAFNEILGDIGPGVSNVNVDVGNTIEDTRVNFTGQLSQDISYRYSGSVADIGGNSTFTVSAPLTFIADADALRYFALEFSRSINPTGNITRMQRNAEFKVVIRLP